MNSSSDRSTILTHALLPGSPAVDAALAHSGSLEDEKVNDADRAQVVDSALLLHAEATASLDRGVFPSTVRDGVDDYWSALPEERDENNPTDDASSSLDGFTRQIRGELV